MALSNYLPNYLSSYFHNNEISRVRKLLATEQEFTVDKPDVKDKAEQQFLKSVILKTGLPEILAKKALINILLIAVPLVCLCILLKKPFILLIH